MAQILEVGGTGLQVEHFLDHRKEVSQRTNGAQLAAHWWAGSGGALRRQHQCVFDHAHGDAALVELRGQHPVRTADGAHLPGVLRYASRTWRMYSSWPPPSSMIVLLNPAAPAATDRQWARGDRNAPDGGAGLPPSAGCPESSAIRHRRDSW